MIYFSVSYLPVRSEVFLSFVKLPHLNLNFKLDYQRKFFPLLLIKLTKSCFANTRILKNTVGVAEFKPTTLLARLKDDNRLVICKS